MNSNIEINKDLAKTAGFVCFVGVMYFADVMQLGNPFVAGVIAWLVVYGIAYCNAGFGAFSIIASIVLCLIAYNHVPS